LEVFKLKISQITKINPKTHRQVKFAVSLELTELFVFFFVLFSVNIIFCSLKSLQEEEICEMSPKKGFIYRI